MSLDYVERSSTQGRPKNRVHVSLSDKGGTWLPSPRLADGWRVSDQGQVKRPNGSIVVPVRVAGGELKVAVRRPNGDLSEYGLAGLVASAFGPHKGNSRDMLRHLNGDKTDCRAANLALSKPIVAAAKQLTRWKRPIADIPKIEGERWRPFPHNVDHLVSDQGRIWVLGLGLRKQVRKPGGHLAIGLTVSGSKRKWTVHAMVMETFIGPRPEGALIRHLNDVPDDNRLVNLEYGTALENLIDRHVNSSVKNFARHYTPGYCVSTMLSFGS